MVSAFGDELFCDICVAELNGCEECRMDVGAVGVVYLGSGVYQCYSDVVALEVLGGVVRGVVPHASRRSSWGLGLLRSRIPVDYNWLWKATRCKGVRLKWLVISGDTCVFRRNSNISCCSFVTAKGRAVSPISESRSERVRICLSNILPNEVCESKLC